MNHKHGESQAGFYEFKSKYCGTDVSDTPRLSTLENENAKFKRVLQHNLLDNVVSEDLRGKIWRIQPTA
ncbi:hypothetical protein [Roseobacter sp.]|uniref:hypothetical protein n=1 Tax=Roseobacter sp. TaxID=1907202 RepID=UPI0038648FA7